MEACLNMTLGDSLSTNDTLEEETTTAVASRVLQTIVIPTVCTFGIVGNILNLAILTRQRHQRSFRTLEKAGNLCLTSLALSDLMFCLAVIPTMFLSANGRYSSNNNILVLYNLYQYFIINIFIMESTLLTVTMSLERFMAICFPLRQDLYLTTRRIKYVIAFTVVFSVSFNVPMLFRYEITPHCALPEPHNLTRRSTAWTLGAGSPEVHLSPADRPNVGPSALAAKSDIGRHGRSVSHPAVAICASGHRCVNVSIFRDRNRHKDRDFINKINNLTTSGAVGIRYSTSPSEHLNVLAPVPPGSFLSPSAHGVASPLAGDQPGYSALAGNISTSSPAANSSAQPLYYTVEQIKIAGSDAVDNAYRWAWAMLGNYTPLFLLFFFNVCLWWKIYFSFKMRNRFLRSHQATRSSHILTITLAAIVVLFFILVAPSETVLAFRESMTADWETLQLIEAVTNTMQTINFSVNFVLYTIISPYFRKTFKYMILCRYNKSPQITRASGRDFEASLMDRRKSTSK